MILSVTVGCPAVHVEASIDTEGHPPLTPELAEHYLARCRQQAFVAFGQFDSEDDDEAEAEEAEA